MTRQRMSSWILGAIALVLTLTATVMIARTGPDLSRSQVQVEGIPVTVVAPADDSARPVVVVVHGFAGSAQIMDPLAVALAEAGYRVFLPDLHGHGANPTPLPLDADGRGSQEALFADIDAVVRYAGSQPGVAPGQLGVVGHSMGAGAAVAYGVRDAQGPGRVRATVALSLPSARDIPNGAPSMPRNLLLMWGGAEPSAFAAAGSEALHAAYPDGEVGRAYGDSSEGTARGTAVIPGVEHIGILFSRETAQLSVDWLDSSVVVGSPGHTVGGDARILWLLVLLVGTVVGFIPLARLLIGSGGGPSDGAPVLRWWWAPLLTLAGAAVAIAVCAPLVGHTPLLPLSVADYAAAWFAVAGAVTGAAAWWVGRRRPRRPIGGPGAGRTVLASLALTAYLVAALALASQHTWAAFALVGPRWWVLLVVEAAFLLFFWSDERLVARASRGRRAVLVVGDRVILVAALMAAAVTGLGPGVLTLWVPLLAVLLVMLGVCAHVIAGLTRERWAVALVQAIPMAYVVATAFPIVAG